MRVSLPARAPKEWLHHTKRKKITSAQRKALLENQERRDALWDAQGIKAKATNEYVRSARTRYRLKRAGLRIMRRIHNLVNDLHKKMAKWITDNYRTMLLPTFETQKMVTKPSCESPKKHRCLNSRAARAMLTWSHYRFRQRLLNKTREAWWCKVYLVTEEYTSKTCGKCGRIHSNLGSNKVFKCPAAAGCGYEVDRDVNGARNVLLKVLTENKIDLRS